MNGTHDYGRLFDCRACGPPMMRAAATVRMQTAMMPSLSTPPRLERRSRSRPRRRGPMSERKRSGGWSLSLISCSGGGIGRGCGGGHLKYSKWAPRCVGVSARYRRQRRGCVRGRPAARRPVCREHARSSIAMLPMQILQCIRPRATSALGSLAFLRPVRHRKRGNCICMRFGLDRRFFSPRGYITCNR